MTGILELPCELVASVFRQLNDVQHILPMRLACRHFNDSFMQHTSLQLEMLRREIQPDLIPHAVASLLCLQGATSRPEWFERFKSFFDDLYHDPARLEAQLQALSFAELAKLSQRHRIIVRLAKMFAAAAWAKMEKQDPLDLSIAEEVRFCRAFYRFELLCSYLLAHEAGTSATVVMNLAKSQILSRNSPWANEQIGCIHDFLEIALLEAIRETLAHDVQFGEYTVSYISRGIDNYWLQGWLARGIEFIDQILATTSNEQQANLLRPTEKDQICAMPVDVLCSETDDGAYDDNEQLYQYSAVKREALYKQSDSTDQDSGPQEAWYETHKEESCESFVMSPAFDRLRQRAYVLWDGQRLQQNGLLELFNGVEMNSTDQMSEEERAEMFWSWEQRSKIWQKSGSEMWYDGDERRIVWRSC